MKLKRVGVQIVALLVIQAALSLTTLSNASMPEKDYLAALKVADQKVQRLKELQSRENALSSGMVKLLFGRFYQPGDSWDVAAWQFDGSQRNHPAFLKHHRLDTPGAFAAQGVFHYEVESIRTGLPSQIILKVTQTESFGMKIMDPRVKAIRLTMTDGIVQSEKHYTLEGDTRPVRVFPDSLHTRISGLELFPLDVPDISTADKKSDFTLPELPPGIRSFSEQFSISPERKRSSWFEQEDFFGRPVQVLWQQGDPWPSYMKTVNGIAILIRQGVK